MRFGVRLAALNFSEAVNFNRTSYPRAQQLSGRDERDDLDIGFSLKLATQQREAKAHSRPRNVVA